jgi:hypothetical protein
MAVNLYAGITKYGVTKPHIMAGTSKHSSAFKNKKGKEAKNITSQEYEHVLRTTLLPEGKRLFAAQGISGWVLQQDNDPSHKKASHTAISAWNNSNPGTTVTLLPHWPPNSPDLNLIENLWATLQAKVDAAGCNTYEEFKECVIKTWMDTPKATLEKLFKGMPVRIQQCIAREGGKTPH